MKTKKFDKKLTLNKKTIADLSNPEMEKIQGGVVSLPLSACCVTEYSKCLTQCVPGGALC